MQGSAVYWTQNGHTVTELANVVWANCTARPVMRWTAARPALLWRTSTRANDGTQPMYLQAGQENMALSFPDPREYGDITALPVSMAFVRVQNTTDVDNVQAVLACNASTYFFGTRHCCPCVSAALPTWIDAKATYLYLQGSVFDAYTWRSVPLLDAMALFNMSHYTVLSASAARGVHRICFSAVTASPYCTLPSLCADVFVDTDPCTIVRADHSGDPSRAQLCQYYDGESRVAEPYGRAWDMDAPTVASTASQTTAQTAAPLATFSATESASASLGPQQQHVASLGGTASRGAKTASSAADSVMSVYAVSALMYSAAWTWAA
jgi:hypothetical protein